jgi:hypothetical protein
MKWPWNTKLSTTCLASGQVAGAGRSGCGDIYGTAGEAAAVRSVMTAAGDALAAAGATRSQVRSAAFRLAGVDWPEDGGFWDIELARQWPGLSRSILNDGYAAIRCGELSGTGVAVNAGTAGAIAARGPDGMTWHMGWWGQHAMGAYGLMSEALRAASPSPARWPPAWPTPRRQRRCSAPESPEVFTGPSGRCGIGRKRVRTMSHRAETGTALMTQPRSG